MYKLFTTALIAAYTQAENVMEDQAVARELAAKLGQDLGRELEALDPAEEGRMLAAEMDRYEERMLSAAENDGRRQLYHYDNDTTPPQPTTIGVTKVEATPKCFEKFE